MTKDEILNMEAGKEIDDLVAEKVMGWYISADGYGNDWLDAENHYQHRVSDGEYTDDENFHLIEWHPSESVLWAWEVVEKIGEKKYRQVYLCTNFSAEFGNQIYAEIFENNGDGESREFIVCSATAETAPLAICRVALIATL